MNCRRYGYKGIPLLVVIIAIALAFSAPACAEETYISASGGAFLPSDDYNEDFDTGLAGSLSYIMVNEYTGFEFGLTGFTTSNDVLDVDVMGLGLEMLVHFHKTDSTFQPFIALGIGRYRNRLDDNLLDTHEYHTGGGLVLKVGARLFLGPRFFIGAYAKRFENNVDFSLGTANLGGDVIYGEMGIVSF